MTTEPQEIKDRVLGAIARGRVFMRPRWYFAATATLGVLGAALAVLLTLFLASFVIALARGSGLWALPTFGSRGLRALFIDLPWAIIGLAALMVIVLEVLVQRFSFGYRKPILVTLGAVVFIVLGGSYVLAEVPLHPFLMRHAAEGRLPFMEGFYRGYGAPRPPDVHSGIVEEPGAMEFILRTDDGEAFTVVVASHTRMFGSPLAGQRVIVAGERDGARIQAFGVRAVDLGDAAPWRGSWRIMRMHPPLPGGLPPP